MGFPSFARIYELIRKGIVYMLPFPRLGRKLGVKYYNRGDKIDLIFDSQSAIIMHAHQHQLALRIHPETFAGYLDKYVGRDAVIVCTGPTLRYYKPKADSGRIHLGVNWAIKYPDVKLDYLFLQDWHAVESNAKEFEDAIKGYSNPDLKKFVGLHYTEVDCPHIVPESFCRDINATRYVVYSCSWLPGKEPNLPRDITLEPLSAMGTTAYTALQFLLYTRPRRIFLVGCDSSGTGHYNNRGPSFAFDSLIARWKLMADYAKLLYPDVEIISVNPVGLRGMFKDVYTAENPDRPEGAELLD